MASILSETTREKIKEVLNDALADAAGNGYHWTAIDDLLDEILEIMAENS